MVKKRGKRVLSQKNRRGQVPGGFKKWKRKTAAKDPKVKADGPGYKIIGRRKWGTNHGKSCRMRTQARVILRKTGGENGQGRGF